MGKSSHIVISRILVGVIVLICAEVFSGASLSAGLWHPWTLVVTFWLYFGHFFFCTTLAVWTGRTSLTSLYLWGVLFGLYESWITKVIWAGYGGDGKLAMGSLGPFGFSEISMVFFFHPIVSFILPLTVICLIWPELRALFPDLAWFTGKSKTARMVAFYLMISFVPVMAMNSGGVVNLVTNLIVAILVVLLLLRLARPADSARDARQIVAFGRRGLIGLCVYLVVLYGASYVLLHPEGLPSIAIQLLTLVFYAVAISGLWLHRRREPQSFEPIQPREQRLVVFLFATLLGLSILCTLFVSISLLYPVIALNFVVWTIGGFVLTSLCWLKGALERFGVWR